MMLFKNKSTKNKRYLYLSVLPLLGVVVFSTLVFNTSKAKEIVREVEAGVEEVKVPVRNFKQGNTELLNNYTAEDTTKNRRNNKQDANSPDLIFNEVEIEPMPPGGMLEFRKWIGGNYQYTQAAIDAGIKGTMEISFIVEKDGNLSDFKLEKDLGYGTGEAAIEMLKNAPNWASGIQNGRKVRVAYTLPIRLDLSSDFVENKEVSTFERVEVSPNPKGGMASFRRFIGERYPYPKSMIESKESGKVNLYFEVDKEGSLTNFNVIEETNNGLGTSLVSILQKYGTWAPAIIDGYKVGYRYNIEVQLRFMNGVGIIEVMGLKSGGFIKS